MTRERRLRALKSRCPRHRYASALVAASASVAAAIGAPSCRSPPRRGREGRRPAPRALASRAQTSRRQRARSRRHDGAALGRATGRPRDGRPACLRGADVKAANRYGVTPLYLAGAQRQRRRSSRLLKAGADANAAGAEGETRADDRRAHRHVDAAKALLAHGAERRRARELARTDGADVGRGRGPPDDDPRARRARRRRQREVERREVGAPDDRRAAREVAAAGRPHAAVLRRARGLRRVRAGARVELGADVNATDSGRHQPDRDRADQRALRRRGRADRRGRRREPRSTDVGRSALYAAVDFNTMPASNRPAPKRDRQPADARSTSRECCSSTARTRTRS